MTSSGWPGATRPPIGTTPISTNSSGRWRRLLAQGQVVGWFQGRMEWGPRALGNRSILGDPRHPEMQKRLNLKIKYREGFRPFAPSVLMEETRQLLRAGPAVPLHAAGGAGAGRAAQPPAAGL